MSGKHEKPADLLRELGIEPGRPGVMDRATLALIAEVRDLKARVAALERPRRTRAKALVGRIAGALKAG